MLWLKAKLNDLVFRIAKNMIWPNNFKRCFIVNTFISTLLNGVTIGYDIHLGHMLVKASLFKSSEI